MAIYNKGGLLGVVGYDEVYTGGWGKPKFDTLINGISRGMAIRLISQMQNRIVGKLFYNPYFDGKTNKEIDAPRFFFGPKNQKELQIVVGGYEKYLRQKAEKGEQPMLYAAASETPLYLLRAIMAVPEHRNEDEALLERNLFKAFLLANDATISREQGDYPYTPENDKELYLSSLMMSRFAYNDITSIKKELQVQLINQTVRCITLFEFLSKNEQLKDIYFDFLRDYGILTWDRYLCTYWSLFALGGYKTGIIDFKRVRDKDHLLEESIIERDSIDIHALIPLNENVDYVAFRRKPFIKIAPREYAVVDFGFLIDKIYNALYFELNEYWKKRFPDNPNEFNRIFTTEYSEEYMLANTLKEVSNRYGWFSLSDTECENIVPKKKLDSPPDFYIRTGNAIVLFEGKDVKIRKEIKSDGTISEIIREAEKSFVGYDDEKGKRHRKGVEQLVKNAKRIQNGEFKWDNDASPDCIIYLVLVLSDPRQVAAGWKNLLCRRMYEACDKEGLDKNKIRPLILTDIGTLYIYKENFLKWNLFSYFDRYIKDTVFDEEGLYEGNFLMNVMNMTMSFSAYLNGEKCLGALQLHQKFVKIIRPSSMKASGHTITKTLVFKDFYDEQPKESEYYLKDIDKQWLIDDALHFISVDSYGSFSMRADKFLSMLFQDYRSNKEVKRLFEKLNDHQRSFPETYPTLINHQALYRLLRKILLMPNGGRKGKSFESNLGVLKALLAENSVEMERERSMLAEIAIEEENRDAMVIMQQDVLNVDMFGNNINELNKVQQLKFLSLCGFAKKHSEKLNVAIKNVVIHQGQKNVYSYLFTVLLPLRVYKAPNNFNEGVLKLRRRDYEDLNALALWNNFVSFIKDKCLDISNENEIRSRLSDSEIIDNTCFKKYPIIKVNDDEYKVISLFYYAQLIYDGFWWAVKNEMVPPMEFREFTNLMSKVFFEKYLFCESVRLLVKKKKIRVLDDSAYSANAPGPDMLIRTKKDLFLFEFKDMRVKGKVAEGSDMAEMIKFIDERLNHKKESAGEGNHGIPQLVRNMEDYYEGKIPDEKDYGKSKVKLHPILVVNSRMFAVRGINSIMQQMLDKRIEESEILRGHAAEIGGLLVVDFDMLLLTIVWCYHDSAEFHRLLYGYMTSLEKADNPIGKCNSFRSYAMKKFEDGMKDPKKKKIFEKGFIRTVRKLLSDKIRLA